MKKVLVILLALSMLFSLAACGGSKETEPAKTDAPAAQSGGKTESGGGSTAPAAKTEAGGEEMSPRRIASRKAQDQWQNVKHIQRSKLPLSFAVCDCKRSHFSQTRCSQRPRGAKHILDSSMSRI